MSFLLLCYKEHRIFLLALELFWKSSKFLTLFLSEFLMFIHTVKSFKLLPLRLRISESKLCLLNYMDFQLVIS